MSDEHEEKEIKVTDKRRYRNPSDSTPQESSPQANESREPVRREAASSDAAVKPADDSRAPLENPDPDTPQSDHPEGEPRGTGEVTFVGLVFSLATSAMMAMGDLADPEGRSHKDLAVAKQTIDLLALLKDKTKGNLSEDEDRLLSQTLRDLRLRYVQSKG